MVGRSKRFVSALTVFGLLLPFWAQAQDIAYDYSLSSAPVQQAPERLSFPFVPEAKETTGSLCDEQNPDFTEYRYAEHIAYCARNVTSATKNEIYLKYHVSLKCKSEYTVDHFIPLSMGGTNEKNNLWPEHKSIKALRQNLEYETYLKLKAGEITRDEAVRIVVDAKLHPPVKNPADFTFCQ